MKLSLAFAFALLAFTFAALAEGMPSPPNTDQTAEVVVLQARVAELEAKLATCTEARATQAEAVPVAQPTNLPAPPAAYVPSSVPSTRYGGGFRMAPEPRLTCEDYSKAYFEKHPTMARVCQAMQTGDAQGDAAEPAEMAPMPQMVSASTEVSLSTTPLPDTAESPTKAQ